MTARPKVPRPPRARGTAPPSPVGGRARNDRTRAAVAPLAGRLDALLTARAAELEASRPRRAVGLTGPRPAARALATAAARRRAEVARVFAPELVHGGSDLLEILDLLLGGPVWDALRTRGLSPSEVARLVGGQVRRALTALAPAAAR